MQRTVGWNFGPTDGKRLADLMKLFGCEDVIAPVDAGAFGKRAGEVISRHNGKTIARKKPHTPTAGNIACGPYNVRKSRRKRATPTPRTC